LRRAWRTYWPIAAIAIAVLAVVIINVVVHRAVEEQAHNSRDYSQIDDGLWLGGYVKEPPPGTHAVLNLCETRDPYQAESHRWEPIPDAAPAPNRDWLRNQVAFVEAERAAGRNVYVHCRAGISRGALVVTAYLMKREKWSRDRALEWLRTRRPGVRPNPAFMELLLEWERSLMQ
jgi:Dual specificity phosphatase, catalytic domain